MAVFVQLEDFWRVGRADDPLVPALEYQGDGRFDDPKRELTVLYGADSALTCIFEVALPWVPHQDAPYVQQAEAPEADVDPELQALELEQAERDRQIALQPFQMPRYLYDKAKVSARLREPVILCNLDDIGVRTELGRLPDIAALMENQRVPHLDRSVITGQGSYREITRAISGYLMRNEFLGYRFNGLFAPSRHAGDCYMLFEGRFAIGGRLIGPIPLNREDEDVREAARLLRLVP